MITFIRTLIGARRRFLHLRGDRLQRYQDERAKKIVAFAIRHSRFYRAHFSAGGDWRTLPAVDKTAMMRNFDTFNTRGVSLDDAMRVAMRAVGATIDGLTVGLSSGTSGKRGIFLVDRREQMIWAATIVARVLPSLRRGLRVAFFLRSNSNLYQTLGRWVDFRYFDLVSPANLDDFQPHILVAPPSMLAKLTTARIRPERVISVAEVLEPQDEARLRDAFGVPVHQIYQSTEGLLAVSCAQGSLHVQEDVVALQFERTGDEDQPVTPIVTDLWRRIQPIIRYRLNDLVVLSPNACSCGSAFRVIERIEGRLDDICHFVQHDGTLRAFYPDALRRMVLVAGVDDYRIVQDAPGKLRVYVEGDVDALRNAITETMARNQCVMPELEIERGVPPVPAGEKRRRVGGRASRPQASGILPGAGSDLSAGQDARRGQAGRLPSARN